MKEVNPEETTRAYAFEMWMNAPMPMVTFFKTLDVTPLVRASRRKAVHGAGRRRGTDAGTFTLHSSGNFRAGRDYQPRCSLINCADKPLARIEISLLRSDNRRPRRGQPESERIHSFHPEILSCIFHKWA